MAFNKNYIVKGNSKQKVRQLGNAVTPPAMKFLTKRTILTLL
jgi:DNA (cytosine-5)-methyltransferase 1